ncbi:hypothetical protein K466DRAFT_317359 [Polyporus arcularius HHB13444]|uniref:Uncharacterized protein n=1 Tax=Polyporus arcularius HHB13444 TaxID=1314778 RepID=A0A5C3P136_9APHY|nr:hypothetical protein K466DRAFT_317359 [Polyporus arcularius HHB13444]
MCTNYGSSADAFGCVEPKNAQRSQGKAFHREQARVRSPGRCQGAYDRPLYRPETLRGSGTASGNVYWRPASARAFHDLRADAGDGDHSHTSHSNVCVDRPRSDFFASCMRVYEDRVMRSPRVPVRTQGELQRILMIASTSPK